MIRRADIKKREKRDRLEGDKEKRQALEQHRSQRRARSSRG